MDKVIIIDDMSKDITIEGSVMLPDESCKFAVAFWEGAFKSNGQDDWLVYKVFPNKDAHYKKEKKGKQIHVSGELAKINPKSIRQITGDLALFVLDKDNNVIKEKYYKKILFRLKDGIYALNADQAVFSDRLNLHALAQANEGYDNATFSIIDSNGNTVETIICEYGDPYYNSSWFPDSRVPNGKYVLRFSIGGMQKEVVVERKSEFVSSGTFEKVDFNNVVKDVAEFVKETDKYCFDPDLTKYKVEKQIEGNFLGLNNKSMLLSIKLPDSAHSCGFQRRVFCIIDQLGNTIVPYKLFASDYVDFGVFRGKTKDFLYVWTSTTWQGATSTDSGFYSFINGWQPILTYIDTYNIGDNTLGTSVWNKEKEIFEKNEVMKTEIMKSEPEEILMETEYTKQRKKERSSNNEKG